MMSNDGVCNSKGACNSKGVCNSRGVNSSFGVMNCSGVDHEIFCHSKKRVSKIFGSIVSERRFYDVWKALHDHLSGWVPTFNNTLILSAYEAWKDMPEEAINYLKAQPEFNEAIFKGVTGIDVKKEEEKIEIEGRDLTIAELKKLIKEKESTN